MLGTVRRSAATYMLVAVVFPNRRGVMTMLRHSCVVFPTSRMKKGGLRSKFSSPMILTHAQRTNSVTISRCCLLRVRYDASICAMLSQKARRRRSPSAVPPVSRAATRSRSVVKRGRFLRASAASAVASERRRQRTRVSRASMVLWKFGVDGVDLCAEEGQVARGEDPRSVVAPPLVITGREPSACGSISRVSKGDGELLGAGKVVDGFAVFGGGIEQGREVYLQVGFCAAEHDGRVRGLEAALGGGVLVDEAGH